MGYGCKILYTDPPNYYTNASSGRELFRLQFLLHAASPETFGYTLVDIHGVAFIYFYGTVLSKAQGRYL
jgi:hypothetical protein